MTQAVATDLGVEWLRELRSLLPEEGQYRAAMERVARGRRRKAAATDPWIASGKEPHEKQRTFTKALLGERYESIIHFGSARAGKSVATCLGLLTFGYRHPGSRILVGRYDHKRLWDSTMVSMGEALGWLWGKDWRHIRDVTPDVGTWEAGLQHLTLVEGPQIAFTHFKEAGPLGSTEYDLAWIEEAQEIPNEDRNVLAGEEISTTPEVVTMIQSRLNRVTPGRGQWGDSSPKLIITAMGWGHNWVWEMAYPRRLARTLVVESNAEDNRVNIPQAWFDRMGALPEAEQRRYLYLSHEDFEGAVFTALTGRNIVKPFPIPKKAAMIRGFDPGVVGVGWVWVASMAGVSKLRKRGWPGLPEDLTDGSLVIFDCWQPREVGIEVQVEKVLERDRRDGVEVLFTAVDPSDSRQQTGMGLKNQSELASDLGLGPMRKAPNDEKAFISKLQYLFSEGKIFIFESCQELIHQLRSEVWDEKAPVGEPRRKYAKQHHLVAATKYAILMEPEMLSAIGERREKSRYPTQSRAGY